MADATKAKKFSRGKQKIEIKKVVKTSNRHVTFSKRKAGVFKKAAELSTLTGVDVGVIVFSQLGKVYSYGNPSLDAVIDRHRQCCRSDGEPRAMASPERVAESSQSVNENAPEENGAGEFWLEKSLDGMDMEELERFKRSLVELRKKVWERAEGAVERESRSCLEKMVRGDDDQRLIGTPVTTEEQWQSFYSYGNPSLDAFIDRHRRCCRSDRESRAMASPELVAESSQSVNKNAPEGNGAGEFWWEKSLDKMDMEELERFKRSMVVWEKAEGTVKRESRSCLEKMVRGDDDQRLIGTPLTTEEQRQSFYGGVSRQVISHGWSSPYNI